MKKYLLLLLLLFSELYFSQTDKDLYGKWKGSDVTKTEGVFTFFTDGYVSMKLGSMVIDGRNYIIPEGPNKGKTAHVQYAVDFSEKPFKFKLIASYNNSRNEVEASDFLNGLIEFKGKSEILLFINMDNQNPSEIDPLSPNSLVLHKEDL